jgi:hypothetical protein
MQKIYKLVVIVLITTFVPAHLQAQEMEPVTEQLISVEDQKFDNKFEDLNSAKFMAYQLRKKYGIHGSVVLSKSFWQILSSYSNQKQAENIWLTALESINSDDKKNIDPLINLQFSSGQVISRYTNGMSLNKWYENKVSLNLSKNNMDDFLRQNDELTLYMYLQPIWQIIIENIVNHEVINWQDVFQDSINIIAEGQNEPVANEIQKTSFLVEYIKWTESEDILTSLADLMNNIDESNARDNDFYISLIRFNLNKHFQYLLAASIDWLEISYHLSQYKDQMTDSEAEKIEGFIRKNNAWFLSNEQQLLSINLRLPKLIGSNMDRIKAFYKDEITIDELENQLTSVYEIIDPRINKYMLDTPFRQKIKTDLEVCINLSESFEPFPQYPIDEKQFRGCIKDISSAAVVESATRELSGSLTKVDTNKQAIDRALQSPSWQIINFLYAKLAQTQCLDQSYQLANPLEWSLAAESVLWFADRWPSYIRAYFDNKVIQDVIDQGQKLNQGFACLEKPLVELLNSDFLKIVQEWQSIKSQINQVTEEFNQLNLSKDSDLNLLNGAEQNSNYRVADAQITACDVQRSCGVHVSLESSRALFGLFPNHLLVADQLQLGQLKLCYDNVGWENRRPASTHLDNTNVANYFGNFSFSVKGFFSEKLVFEKKIVSSKEYHYLFAENNEEVLSTYCPLSIVGNKISTQLARGTYGLVPNRLTFLTASRASETNILTSNWSSGDEWRDKLLDADNNSISGDELLDVKSDVQIAYQLKATQLQDLIYSALMNTIQEPTAKQKSLSEGFQNLQRMTNLLQASLTVDQVYEMLTNDQLHSLFYGMEKIPNLNTIVSYYKNQLNINQLIVGIDENLKNNQIKWNNLSAKRSHTYLNNILYRLKNIQF